MEEHEKNIFDWKYRSAPLKMKKKKEIWLKMPSKEHLLTSFREKLFFLCKGEPEGDGTRSLELELENARDDEEEEEEKRGRIGERKV